MNRTHNPYIKKKRLSILSDRKVASQMLFWSQFTDNPLLERYFQNQFNQTIIPNEVLSELRRESSKEYTLEDDSGVSKEKKIR